VKLSTLVLQQLRCASGKPSSAKSLWFPAPVRGQVQILACERSANIIQCKSFLCQVKNFLFDARSQVLYNIYID
jgi:hypothetical protein